MRANIALNRTRFRAPVSSTLGCTMHSHNPKVLDAIKLQCFSATEDGMHVELVESKDNPGPLITFREDESLGMQVLLHMHDRDLAFPLAELERAIAFAKQEVHKESFYD